MLSNVQQTPSTDASKPAVASSDARSPASATSAEPPMRRAGAQPGDHLEVAKADAPAAPVTPPFNEKIAEIPVVGRVYTAYKLAQVALFEDLKITPNDPPPNNGPVMTVFKTVIGVPVMTVGFLIAAAFAGKD